MRHRKRLLHAALVGSLQWALLSPWLGPAFQLDRRVELSLVCMALRRVKCPAPVPGDPCDRQRQTLPRRLTRRPDDNDLADQNAQYDYERTAPAAAIEGPALATAEQQASQLPQTDGNWQEFTNQPYQAEPTNYTDPFWGNEGAGFSLVGGRTTALVAAPDGAWFAGTADGGVWRSRDQGTALDASLRLDADAVHRRTGHRPGRRFAVGRHR